ncbi:redoxin domain-containing protein [Sphingobacterium thalpophilum]|uniref:TlpA disulfide reductase family protein n=1 Tax=Sphingobacterium TaxID=28453 RepID=UPI002242D30C|nr:TlpA disulfide reductase family protein [Sphingobacterium sp. InxBP1]MCW8313836.1 AhpC/TSA family protein [Sphingobacterium sp. InxBP1]
MKIKILLIQIVLLLPFLGFAQKEKKDRYVIHGQIDRMPQGKQYVYLSSVVRDHELHTDSVLMKDGKFTFRGRVDEPCMVNIYIIVPGRKYPATMKLFLENAKINLRATWDKSTHDYVKNLKITGSKVHEENEDLFEGAMKRSGRDQIREAYIEAEKRRDTAQMRALTNANRNALELYTKDINDWIAANPNSFATLRYKSMIIPTDEAGLNKFEAELGRMDPVLRSSFLAQTIYAEINEQRSRLKIAPGTMAIDFVQPDKDGQLVRLSDYRGKYVFVDFWASWCVPCRAENPHVLKAYNDFHKKGLEILSVSVDEKREAWLKAIEQDHLPWTQVSDLKGWENSASRSYLIKAIPANFLIDPSGKIIASGLRGDNLHKELERVFRNIQIQQVK